MAYYLSWLECRADKFIFWSSSLMSAVLASLFIVFIVYEQCEEEIDSIIAIASVKVKRPMDRVARNLPTALKAYIP
jgi:plant 3beta-hydroxysteroid-4alpha-carboxylate 3-dehydrogenase